MLERFVLSCSRFALALLPLTLAVPAQVEPNTNAAWRQFQQDAGGHWLVDWNAATNTPRSIYGEGLALSDWRENTLDEARRHAQLAMQRWPELLGLGTSDFRERIGARLGRTWSLCYDQYFRGLPVVGGRVDVRIHMRGRLAFLGSTAWPVPARFDIAPTIDEANATRLAWLSMEVAPNEVPQPGTARPTQLVIYGEQNAATAPFALAWEVPVSAVDTTGSGPIGRVYIDAKTGQRLGYANDRHECGLPGCGGDHPAKAAVLPLPATYTVMAWTHAGVSPIASPTNVPLAGVEVVVPGLGTLITDANGQFTADLTAATAVTVNLNGVHCSLIQGSNAMTATSTLQPGVNSTIQLGTAASTERPLAHSTTYYWVYTVNEWARSILGNSPELAVADLVAPVVNITSTCNAYYSGNSINFYRSGGGCNNTAGASVIAHEWGHGLDDRYGGISQTNGLSEGWGDICSMYLLDDPLIGHNFSTGGGGIRNGNNNQQYPQGSGVHAQGESWMGFAWLFRENLRTAFGTTQAITISNDLVLGSIVANAQDQPSAVLQVFLADDDDGNLANGTPHHAFLAAACQGHSLPFPAIQPGYFAHTPLTNTSEQGKPRLVTIDAIPVTGSFQQVRLHWNDGQAQQRDMVPSGQGNTWQALLPPLYAPQSLTYHFEALHSNNTWMRLPLSGEYNYGINAQYTFFREGFETGAPGWSHGAVTGQDDWEIGTPLGRSGPGWTDPSAAANGLHCAGTDLLGDGAYAPSSEMWLRSPPIDCTGITGIHLRCRVWASCESPSDGLEIRVSGQTTWLSSFAPRTDTQWSTLDLTLAQAQNQPAVTIEFRLRSNGLFEYGGWNLDDIELYSTTHAVPLPAMLSIAPAQASQGSPVAIAVQTSGSRPFLLAIGDQPGPLAFPGVPLLQAGGSLLTVFDFTDQNGQYNLAFQAPSGVPLQGLFWYSHVLTLDAQGAIVGSNAWVNLFTQ